MTGYAGIALSASSVPAEQPVTATLVIQNTGASAVTISTVTGYATPGTPGQSTNIAGAVQFGQPNIGPGYPTSIAASSSVTITLPLVAHTAARALGQLSQGAPLQYAINATITFSDGTSLAAAATTLTVSDSFPLPAASAGGYLDFHVAPNTSLIL